MKKLTKILALVLALTLVLSLAACGKGDSIVGTWKYNVDFQKAMSAASGESEGFEEMAEQLGDVFEGLTMVMVMDLKEDNTFTLSFDEASVKAAAEGMKSKMTEALPALVASMYGMSEDELKDLLAQQGTSMDELIAQMSEEFNSDEMAEELKDATVSGTYAYADGKLTLKAEEGEDVMTVELKGNELKVTDLTGSDVEDYKVLLPMTFNK